MPIRINLLAEAKAQELVRRRDPVKRAVLVGVCLVFALLAYSSQLQLTAMLRKGEANRLESEMNARTNDFREVTQNQAKLADVTHKLTSLHQLACSRLLYGSLLNGMQQAVVDDVQLTRFRSSQTYALTEGVKPKTNSDNRIILGRPATVTESITLTLDAKDSSLNAGDQVNKFKQTLASSPYFRCMLGGNSNEVKLVSLSPPIKGTDGKAYVQFSLEVKFPEKTR